MFSIPLLLIRPSWIQCINTSPGSISWEPTIFWSFRTALSGHMFFLRPILLLSQLINTTRYVGYPYFNELKQPCCGSIDVHYTLLFAFLLLFWCLLHALHLIGFIAYAHLVVFIEVVGIFLNIWMQKCISKAFLIPRVQCYFKLLLMLIVDCVRGA